MTIITWIIIAIIIMSIAGYIEKMIDKHRDETDSLKEKISDLEDKLGINNDEE